MMKKGFTLIELSLSIVFIAILSITIMLIINNTISSYRRGVTLNKINTVGMDLVDEMRATVQNSPAGSVVSECETISDNNERSKCQKDGGYNFISVVRLARVTIGGGTEPNVPVFGAFCTGSYSYIWNSGYFFSGGDASVLGGVSWARLRYTDGGGNVVTIGADERGRFKLLKVEDDSREVCISAVRNNYRARRLGPNYDSGLPGTNVGFDIASEFNISGATVVNETPVDLLADGEDTNNNLAIYNLMTTVPAENSAGNDLFYAVSFILGTTQGGINVKAAGNFCATPEGYNSEVENFDYCAINKFNFAAQAIGG